MTTRGVCVNNEWYHCFCRGVDKRDVFLDPNDYERFMTLLYVSNATKTIHISGKRANGLQDFLNDAGLNRGEQLVEIGAYALMPNHPHLALRQLQQKGIARFMQKVFTGYTMYFNLKYYRTGALFGSSYKSKHVANDEYFKQLISYILLNPVELFEPQWKEGVGDVEQIHEKLLGYKYSSLHDFLGVERDKNKIVSSGLSDYYENKPTLSQMLADALEYYREHSREV
jgi:putative transposase